MSQALYTTTHDTKDDNIRFIYTEGIYAEQLRQFLYEKKEFYPSPVRYDDFELTVIEKDEKGESTEVTRKYPAQIEVKSNKAQLEDVMAEWVGGQFSDD